MSIRLCRSGLMLAMGLATFASVGTTAAWGQGAVSASGTAIGEVVETYCVSCHNERMKSGQLVLDGPDFDHPEQNREL